MASVEQGMAWTEPSEKRNVQTRFETSRRLHNSPPGFSSPFTILTFSTFPLHNHPSPTHFSPSPSPFTCVESASHSLPTLFYLTLHTSLPLIRQRIVSEIPNNISNSTHHHREEWCTYVKIQNLFPVRVRRSAS
jgi:hypothetical protein